MPEHTRADTPAIEVERLGKTYPLGRGRHREELKAVDEVSFILPAGSSAALVGESGSGKSTCARIIVGLERATAGTVRVDGHPVPGTKASRAERRAHARRVQIVFQDPYSSLDPRQRIGDALAEILKLHFALSAPDANRRISELLELVGLDTRHARAYPRTLSGGQRQRAAIARALAAEPRTLILDEAVAALDVSIQAQILAVLGDVREATGVALLFITHDLAVAEVMCETAIVMQTGRIVESGAMTHVLTTAQHPYTRELLAAVPRRGWKPKRRPGTAATAAPSPKESAIS